MEISDLLANATICVTQFGENTINTHYFTDLFQIRDNRKNIHHERRPTELRVEWCKCATCAGQRVTGKIKEGMSHISNDSASTYKRFLIASALLLPCDISHKIHLYLLHGSKIWKKSDWWENQKRMYRMIGSLNRNDFASPKDPREIAHQKCFNNFEFWKLELFQEVCHQE